MQKASQLLIFLCSSATKAGSKKLSFRIASQMEELQIGTIASLEDLSAQHSFPNEHQKKMMFLNDCRSGCVNVLTHGFSKDNFIFVDVHEFISQAEFNIENFIHSSVLPKLIEKWPSGESAQGASIL